MAWTYAGIIGRSYKISGKTLFTFATLRERIRVECEVSRLQYDLSADSLLLIDDYQRRLKVLTALGYVTKGNMVSFKGRVACEIHHQELLITELILESKLHLRSPAEVAALLSVTTCQYKNGQEVKFEEGSIFELLRKDVEEVSNKIEAVATSLRTRVFDAGDELRYDLMQVVYHWASGMVS
uniref:DSHCT domain-containing protein n=1 Tax=Heterorhabditis bacteriophora TaxID=37862 RepID=A0A1I7WN15_HETBA